MRLRAGAGSVLGIAGVVALVTHLNGLGFDSQTLAYGSVYHLLGWFLVVVAAAACVMGVLVVVWTTRKPYTSRRHVPMANLNWFWLTTAAIWASGIGVLVLGPVLT